MATATRTVVRSGGSPGLVRVETKPFFLTSEFALLPEPPIAAVLHLHPAALRS